MLIFDKISDPILVSISRNPHCQKGYLYPFFTSYKKITVDKEEGSFNGEK